jgi:hypothetical protein
MKDTLRRNPIPVALQMEGTLGSCADTNTAATEAHLRPSLSDHPMLWWNYDLKNGKQSQEMGATSIAHKENSKSMCRMLSLMAAGTLLFSPPANLFAAEAALPPTDWLINPAPFLAQIHFDAGKHELTLENGLTRRTLRLAPNAATIDYSSLVTGEQMLRATGPEARVTLNGTEYAVGGLEGQPIQNYLEADWIDTLRANPAAYQFADWNEEPVTARFAWQKRPEWLSRDLPWPAPGRQVTLRFVPPVEASARLSGKVLFEESFTGQMDSSWKIRVSDRNSRSSFSNEGRPGEIYTPPDTAVYAEHPWPAGAVSAEVTVDAGDDALSNAWGPGLALVTPGGTVTFIVRPNQLCYEANGTLSDVAFDRTKPVTLRVRLEGKMAYCEASQGGENFKTIATVDCPKIPTALRVGKVGRDGVDFDSAAGDPLVRCHVLHVVLREAELAGHLATARKDLPEIDVHYVIYDGIPLIEKWLTIRNTTGSAVRVNKLISETLNVNETEGIADPNINMELPSLYVESDYAFLAMNGKSANKQTVKWLTDPSYETQTSYFHEGICRLEVAPEFGPDTDVAPGETMTSVRAFELFRDGSDRERRGLEQRRMYRVVAPWSQENPVMIHLISSDPAVIHRIIDQAAEVGVEMIILSFGSGMNLESTDPAYWAKYRTVADYARSKGIVIGGYSLLASRSAATEADNCQGPGNRIRYGVMPCLGSVWGEEYLSHIKSFMTNTGFAAFENDGSYPGDTCAATNHPGHHGLADSQWVQFHAMAGLYQWCCGHGIYLNVPDWYFLNGSTKTAMGYRESNWSLPRAEQEIIERQNVYDGTWEKTSSMGWMMVPLTQYQGGGAAATIEPLHEHLPHYEARLADLLGAGVQACYRGPRIYDTDDTKAVVKKWITFYKQHREVLDADLIHLRRPDGRDWDGFLHVNPQGKEKGLAMFYNPLAEPIERHIRVPLYYAGLTDQVLVRQENDAPEKIALARDDAVELTVKIPARGRTWFVFTAPADDAESSHQKKY